MSKLNLVLATMVLTAAAPALANDLWTVVCKSPTHTLTYEGPGRYSRLYTLSKNGSDGELTVQDGADIVWPGKNTFRTISSKVESNQTSADACANGRKEGVDYVGFQQINQSVIKFTYLTAQDEEKSGLKSGEEMPFTCMVREILTVNCATW